MYNKIFNVNMKGCTLGGTVFKKKNGIITVTRELGSIEEKFLVKNKKFIWDNRWLITLKSESRGQLYVKPYGLSGIDDQEISVTGEFDRNAMATIPMIVTKRDVKFVPFSNLKYDIDVKLLNQDNEFYRFF